MSQFFVGSTAGSLPPSVAEEFDTQLGNAVPSGHIVLFNGYDSIENNVNGITTKGGVSAGDPPGSGVSNEMDVYLTNRISVTATTSDGAGQTQNVVLMTPASATSLTFRLLVTAYDSANDIAIGGQQIGLIRTLLGVVTVVGTNDTFDESDVALATCDWNVINTSPTLSMQFVGVAGHSIAWRALFEYTQVP